MGLEILVPAFVGAAAVGASSYFNKRATDKNYQSVIDTNATNVALNRETREWNAEQIEKQNEYNSPLQQRLRAEVAGLNPLMMNSDSGLQSVAVQSSAPVTSPFSAPIDSPVSAISSLFQNISAAMVSQAQAKNLSQGTKKLEAETSILSSDAAFRDAFNQNRLVMDNCQIVNLNADTKVKEEQIPLLRAEVAQIDANIASIHQNIQESIARVALLESQNEGQKVLNDRAILDYLFESETFETRKKMLVSELNCTEAQAVNFLSSAALARSEADVASVTNQFLTETLSLRKNLVKAELRTQNNTADLVRYNANNQKWIFDYNTEHGETDMVYRRIGMVTGSVSDLSGAVGQFIKGKGVNNLGEGSVRYDGVSSSTSDYYSQYKSKSSR